MHSQWPHGYMMYSVLSGNDLLCAFESKSRHRFLAVLSLCSYIPVKEDTLLPPYVASKEFFMLLCKCFYLFVCILYNDPFSAS
jgi:hypothetical protein